MNITGCGVSLDPGPGRGQWGRDCDSPPLRLGWVGRHQLRGSSRGWCLWFCLVARGAGGLWGLCLWAEAEESEGKADVMGMRLMGGSLVSAAGLLSCSNAGGERDSEFLPSKARWGTLWKKREERVTKMWHAPLHRPTYLQRHPPSPIPCKRLETGTLSPRFWLPLEIERPLGRLRALPPRQLPRIPSPVKPTGSKSQPHPHPIAASLPKMGALEQRRQFLLPLLCPPPPHPPCRGSQENDLSCWGGGWGRSWSLSSARTLTHTHTLRQTAAAQAAPPSPSASLRRHLPSCLLSVGGPGHPHSITGQGEVSLPHMKEKGKTSQFPSVGLLGEQKREIGLSPRPQKGA